jgi:hypothetical protein
MNIAPAVAARVKVRIRFKDRGFFPKMVRRSSGAGGKDGVFPRGSINMAPCLTEARLLLRKRNTGKVIRGKQQEAGTSSHFVDFPNRFSDARMHTGNRFSTRLFRRNNLRESLQNPYTDGL